MNAETPLDSGLLDLDPFDIFDAEAARLRDHFAGLTERQWDEPSRCTGWSVRDVLAHLAGEELYNHACLDDTIDDLFGRLQKEGVGDLDTFNDWTVRVRRDLPVERIVEEWRRRNDETRRRMRELGRDGVLTTMVGPYPVGLQAFHYSSEYATHADDVGARVEPAEIPTRTRWRARVGLMALRERDTPAEVTEISGGYRARAGEHVAELTLADFVDVTTGRLPADHPLAPELREALRCLA